MSQTGFSCYRCKHWAARSPDNAKLDGDECLCDRPLHPGVVRRRQTEAAINAIIFGGLAFLVLSLVRASSPTFWGIIFAVVVVAYVSYLWLFGRQLRRERPNNA